MEEADELDDLRFCFLIEQGVCDLLSNDEGCRRLAPSISGGELLTE